MKTTDTIEDLHDALKRLKLSNLRGCLDSLLYRMRRGRLTPAEILLKSMQTEINAREQKRIEMNIRLAKFPRVCTLEGFDFSINPQIERNHILELAQLRWIRNKSNILFLGPPGVGKTHLAIALGRQAIQQGYSVRFTDAVTLLKTLKRAAERGYLTRKLNVFCKPDLLIIDELGYLPVDQYVAHLLFQLISARYEHGSVIITSNRPVRDWGNILGDVSATAAMLDRLLHRCEVLMLHGQSYRLLEQKRAGVLKN